MEFVALVDISADALKVAGQKLGLPASPLFTDAQAAFESVEADFCCIVTPPQFHRAAVELACGRSLDIISEKTIAATWEDTVSIYQIVHQAGVKMLVTQNYRYTPRILTLKKRSPNLDRLITRSVVTPRIIECAAVGAPSFAIRCHIRCWWKVAFITSINSAT